MPSEMDVALLTLLSTTYTACITGRKLNVVQEVLGDLKSVNLSNLVGRKQKGSVKSIKTVQFC